VLAYFAGRRLKLHTKAGGPFSPLAAVAAVGELRTGVRGAAAACLIRPGPVPGRGLIAGRRAAADVSSPRPHCRSLRIWRSRVSRHCRQARRSLCGRPSLPPGAVQAVRGLTPVGFFARRAAGEAIAVSSCARRHLRSPDFGRPRAGSSMASVWARAHGPCQCVPAGQDEPGIGNRASRGRPCAHGRGSDSPSLLFHALALHLRIAPCGAVFSSGPLLF